MSGKAKVGNVDGKVEKKNCIWDKCETLHDADPDPPYPYPNNGRATRSSLSKWSHPSSMIGVGKHIPVYKGNQTPPDYAFQRHHILPCAVFKKLVQISNNLVIVGFNINKEDLNGISLPVDPDHMIWHGLQYHRGYHKLYNDHVFQSLQGLEGKVGGFCATDDQGKLWAEIEKKVNSYKKKILNWQPPLLFPDAKIRFIAAFAKKGITIKKV